ncbi:MAG: LysM peptidoglycan-binding domain-containing protein [Chloroflexi bacterium]|nr:LysM peptidoglycan-binding domain-containing protein [Chloroflexota bacterium]
MTNSPGESEKPFVYKSETAANRTGLLPAVRSAQAMRAAGLGHCPNCNASVPPGTSICPQCGHFLRALAKQIRCRRCGQRASSNLVICPHCGRDLVPAPSRLLVWGAPVLLVALFFAVLLSRGHNGNPITWTQNKVAASVKWVTRLGDSMAPGISIMQITPTPVTLVAQSEEQILPVAAVQVAENTQNVLTQSVTISNAAPLTSTVAAVIVATVPPTATLTDTPTVVPTAQPTASFTPLPTRTALPTATETATPVDTATVPATATTVNTPTVVQTVAAVRTTARTPVAATTPVGTKTAVAKTTPGESLVLVATATPVNAAVNGQPNSGPTTQTNIASAVAASTTLTATTKTAKASLTLVPTAPATPITTPTSPAVTSASVAPTPTTYEVQTGDTLGGIAVRFDVTNEALMAANNLTGDDIYRLRPGQSLIIPTTDSSLASVTPTTTATRTYVIQAGDTPLQIASAFGISAAELLAANNLSGDDARSLRVGQVLTIPGDDQLAAESQASPTPTAQATVTAQPTPSPTRASVEAAVVAQPKFRLDAPQLRSPESNAAISCNGNNALIWQSVPFMLDSDRFVLHLGFVNGHDTAGQETITWVLEQIQPPNNTAWNMDPGLCALAPQDLGRQWRWYVEVMGVDNQPVSLPSPYWGFSWN